MRINGGIVDARFLLFPEEKRLLKDAEKDKIEKKTVTKDMTYQMGEQ